MPSLDTDQNLLLKVKIKHFLAKSISLILLFNGLRQLGFSFYEIFHYTQELQSQAAIGYTEFQSVLKVFMLESIEAIIETVYGMILFFTHSHKLKLAHILIGATIVLLPWLINDQILRQVETSIPQVNLSTPVYAQELTPEQAFKDYEFQLQKYREAHKNYLNTKNVYLSFQTLNAKSEAVNATKQLLTQRDETLRTYLLALRVALQHTPGTPNSTISSLILSLTEEEKFLKNHQQQIPPIQSTADLTQVSATLESRYPNMQTLAFNGLYHLLYRQQLSWAEELTSAHGTLQSLVNTTTPSEINQPQVNQWLADSLTKLAENQADYTEATDSLEKMNPESSSLIANQRHFTKVITLLSSTNTRILQTSSYLSETINHLKYD